MILFRCVYSCLDYSFISWTTPLLHEPLLRIYILQREEVSTYKMSKIDFVIDMDQLVSKIKYSHTTNCTLARNKQIRKKSNTSPPFFLVSQFFHLVHQPRKLQYRSLESLPSQIVTILRSKVSLKHRRPPSLNKRRQLSKIT